MAGNPVSAYVCWHLFVARALRACGARAPAWPEQRVRLAHAHALDARPEYARAQLRYPATDDLPLATIIGNQVPATAVFTTGTVRTPLHSTPFRCVTGDFTS